MEGLFEKLVFPIKIQATVFLGQAAIFLENIETAKGLFCEAPLNFLGKDIRGQGISIGETQNVRRTNRNNQANFSESHHLFLEKTEQALGFL